MSLVYFLLLGVIVGALERVVIPGRQRRSWVVSMVFGVVGACLGGFLGRFLGLYREGESIGFAMAALGAVVSVSAYSWFDHKSQTA